MSDKFDTTSSRWAHQGFKDSDYAQLKEKLERTQLECERLRTYASRRDEEMQHQAKLAMDAREDRDAWRTLAKTAEAEVERLKAGGCARDQRTTQFCAEAVALAKERDAWREVARELTYEVKLWLKAFQQQDPKSTGHTLLARFAAMEKGKL